MSTALDLSTPFDGDALLAWLAARAVPGVEEVDGDRYRRVLPDGAVLDVTLGPDHAQLHAGPAAAAIALLDLDTDPAQVTAALGGDEVLGALVARRPGLRRPGTVDAAELAVRAVLGQQVSVAAARTLAGRLAAAAGTPVPGAGGTLTHAFPSPAALAALDPGALPMPRARGRTLVGLARALDGGDVVLDPAEPDRARAALLALPGIGPWTVEYVAMRALRDRDAFPVTDLVVRQAARALGLPDAPRALTARAQAWRPWRAYAAQHLWASTAPSAG